MADGRVDIETRLESGNIRRDVQRVNNELGRIGSNMNGTARDVRNTMGREMNGMVGDSEYYARKYRRAYGNEIGGLMHDMGGSFKYMSAEAQNMMFEMMEGFHAQKMAMIPFKEDQIKATYGFYKMAQASKDFQGTNQEFINQANEIGKAMKKSQDDQINANRLAMMGMLETMGVMNAMSSLASKTTKNLDQMKNPLYNTARPALALVDSLDKVARSGSAAQIALELHGPQASMKTLTDETMRLNSIMMGMPILAMGVGMSAYFMYGALHKANMELDPKYAKAYNDMIEKLTKALEPMRQAFTAVMVPVFNFVTKLAEMTIAFNEAHPAMARFIQGTIMLVPALMALMLPLGLGVGYFRGLRAILFALRPIIMPIVTAFATMSTPVWILAAAIAGLTVGFTHFYKTNEKFKGFVDGTIKSIKDFSKNLVENGKELLNNAYKSDMVQNSIKSMQNGLNVAGQKSKEFGLNMLNMGKYLYETAKSGDAMNEWVGHLPEKYQRAAEGVGKQLAKMRTSMINAGKASLDFGKNLVSMGKYFGYIMVDGDYYNDWITHLPETWQGTVMKIGAQMSKMRDNFLSTIPAVKKFGNNLLSLGKYFGYIMVDGDQYNDWVTHLPDSWQGTALKIGTSLSKIRQSTIDWVSQTAQQSVRLGVTTKDMASYFYEVAKSGDFANSSLMKLPVNMITTVKSLGISLAEMRANFLMSFPVIGQFGQNLLNLVRYIGQVALTGDIMNGWLTTMTGGFQNFAIGIGTAIEQAKTTIGAFIEAVRLALGGDTSQLALIFQDIIPTLITFIIGGFPALIFTAGRIIWSIIEGIDINIPMLLQKGIDMLVGFIASMVSYLPQIIQFGIDVISRLIDGLVIAIPAMVEQAVNVITTLISTLINGILPHIPSLINSGLDILTNIIKGIFDNLPKVTGAALDIIDTLLKGISDLLPDVLNMGGTILKELAKGIKDKTPEMTDAAMKAIEKFLDQVKEKLPSILENGIKILKELIKGIDQTVPDLIDSAMKSLTAFLEEVNKHMPEIMDKGGEILAMLVLGILMAIPDLIVAIGKLLWNILVTINENFPKLKKAGKELIVNLILGIIDWALKLDETMNKVIDNYIIKAFTGCSKWLLDAGKDIMNGLINGIKSKLNNAKEVMGDVASSIKKTINNFFDIHSPSRVMKETGGFITQGLGIGIGDKARFAINKAKSLAEAVMDGFQAITEDIQMGDIVSGDIDSTALQSSFASSKRFVNDMVNVNPTSQQVAYKTPKQEQQIKTASPDNNQSNQGNTYIVLDKKVVGEALAQPVETTNNRRKQRLAQFKPTVTPSF
ncbi:carbamoyl-phosphate synthase large subunit [Bacillus cereus]|uniref:Carbamoyl-phosphate synthase large subunit n=1 Tax=Bacillus cereus TaxID=1396 RepID=A0A9X6UK77_BACCE|nr:carbamoyl-phosphate synthase large subunit [Bacillus cereus]PEQ84180.1 carbamoyl-phosphate synthase large subunit [Bacillus cereus]PET50519.1 carbamoyl-phosphate synthase large subunit [Bacillus cereus]PFL86580.1 carbamoyl-phosphate synthase large subunit [Bacillus cereus]